MKKCLIIFFFLVAGMAKAQPETYEWLKDSAVIRVIATTREFAEKELKLQTGPDFYAWEIDSLTGYIKCRTVKKMHCYVYAWDPQTKNSPLDGAFRYFGTDERAAGVFTDSLKQKGHETMLYKTAGTSAAQLTSRMLEYDPMSICFIMLHESVHRHRANTGSPLPYVFEEALCDLVANQHLIDLKEVSFQNSQFYFVYNSTNLKLYRLINQAAAGEISLKKCNKRIRGVLKSGDAFQKDRFGYTVNHAYLERYRSYCRYYFLLQKVWNKTGDRQKFFDTVFNLKGSEKEVEEQLKKLAGE